jgi:hypothetical protein
VAAEVKDDPGILGTRILGRTACAVAERGNGPGDRVACRELRRNRGVWEIRFEAADVAAVRRLQTRVFERVERAVPGASRRSDYTEPVAFRPTATRTAPIWATVLGLGLALLLPTAPVRPTLRRWDRDGWLPLAA